MRLRFLQSFADERTFSDPIAGIKLAESRFERDSAVMEEGLVITDFCYFTIYLFGSLVRILPVNFRRSDNSVSL